MITDSHDLTAFVTQYRDWIRDLFFIRGTDRQNEISAAERKPLCSNRAVAFVLAGLSLCYLCSYRIPRLFMRDPDFNRNPGSLSTGSYFDPRPVSGTRRLCQTRLLSEVLRYIIYLMVLFCLPLLRLLKLNKV